MKIIKAKIPERIIKNTSTYKYNNTFTDIEKLQEDILKCYDKKSTVILVGQVQSGKTKFVIDLIYKALYNEKFNFDAIVYFSGLNNELNNQALERFKNENLFGNVVSSKDLEGLNNTKKIVIVSIKQKDNLRLITNFLANNSSEIEKILIVDDESDYGAINSKSREDSYNNRCSPIYKEIYNDMYRMCGNSGGFLKLTATPFVDILTEKDIYKTNEPYLFSIPTNDDYTGVKFFNNLNENFWYPIIKDNNYEPYNIESAKKDVINAFFLWVYKSYLLYQDKAVPNFNKSDLLINVFNKVKYHKIICDILANYVYMKINTFKQEMKIALNEEMKFNLNDEIVNKIYNFYFDNIKANNIELVEFNRNKNSNKSLDKNYNVIVGGNLLSRGKSFENLLCELIVIKEKSQLTYDTLLQKCRWFGYRKPRAKYMALICNERIKNKLKEIELIINMFHDGNYGHRLNYHEILNTLRKHSVMIFDNEYYSNKGKIKYAKRTKTIHHRGYR